MTGKYGDVRLLAEIVGRQIFWRGLTGVH